MTDRDGLTARFRAVAAAHPDRAALVLPTGLWHRPGAAGFATTSYAELLALTDDLAGRLRGAGIGPGTRTVLMVPPGVDFFALAFALLDLAATPVLVDPGLGLRTVRRSLDQVRPAAFVGVRRAQLARLALRWAPGSRLNLVPGSARSRWWTGLADVSPSAPVDEASSPVAPAERHGGAGDPGSLPGAVSGTDPSPAAIAFTSGSTGPAKGVEYHQEQFLAQLDLIRRLWDVRSGEVSLATFPPFALLGPALGLTTVIPRMDPSHPAKLDPARLADAANAFGATLMFASPAVLDRVGRWTERTGARLPTLTRVISAGAPVRPAVQRRFLAALDPQARIYSPYGATEALPVTSISSDDALRLTGRGVCVGRPVPGVDVEVIPIVDGPIPTLDTFLPAGEVGEIVVRGPNVTTAYADLPAATAAAKTRWDGRAAHRMGDVGHLDTEGRLWFCGRAVHRVQTADGTLYSVPCEQIFDEHPAVFRSALVGVGPAGRQRPVLCIELEAGRRADDRLTTELLALGAADEQTAGIHDLLYHRGFPVDIRHNAKIDRAALARWATRQLPRGRP